MKDGPVDDELNLDCCRVVDIVVDGSPSARVFEVLRTFLVVICSRRLGWLWIDAVDGLPLAKTVEVMMILLLVICSRRPRWSFINVVLVGDKHPC